ncbi:hypothetical protein MEO41_27715, partial [Dolichospermum sp. ST_sed4]|nr:hypothetical protein [Dolichospermum sp. ST_sed4]
RGLSLAGSVAGGVAGGAAVGGGSNLVGGLVKTVGLVAGGLLVYNTIIRKAQAQMLSITQQLIHISGLLQYVANNIRRSRGQGGSPSSGGGLFGTGMTGIAGLLGGLKNILPLLGTIGVSFVALSVTLGLVVAAIGTIVAAMVAFKLAIQGVQMLLETF